MRAGEETPRSHEAGAMPRAQVGKEETRGSDGPLLLPQTRHGSQTSKKCRVSGGLWACWCG